MLKKLALAVSLIELIISILIISISLTSIVMAYFQAAKSPSTAAIDNALNIVNYYFNEILSKNFPTVLPCIANNKLRINYTNICDYNNLQNLGAKDQNNNSIQGLESYNIYVNLDTSSNSILGNLHGASSIVDAQIIRIDLKITHPSMPDLIVSTYKGKH